MISFAIPEEELAESFMLASGPGGQKVNKTSSAVRLAWDIAASRVLDEELRAKLLARLAGRLCGDGAVLAVTAREFRTQPANRAAALRRLYAVVAEALIDPKKRRPTRPTAGGVRRRLEAKKLHAEKKRRRRDGFD